VSVTGPVAHIVGAGNADEAVERHALLASGRLTTMAGSNSLDLSLGVVGALVGIPIRQALSDRASNWQLCGGP
jgi:hypothetical protein